MLTVTAPGRGIITIYVDGTSQGTIDLYAAALTYDQVKSLAINILSDGVHTLNLKVTGKNALATEFICLLTSWWLRD